MSIAVLAKPAHPAVRPEVVAGLALAAGIAWLQPFDLLFAAVSLGQPGLRAILIVALALTGGALARAIGLRVTPPAARSELLFPVLVAIGVAVACALIDRAFAPVLHPAYVHAITRQALALRTAGYVMRAFNENIIYRLFLGTLLAWLLGRCGWRDAGGRPAGGAMWCGFGLAQLVNIGVNVTALAPLSPLALVHDALRYVAPGMVWSWLYMRRGFRANEIASTSVHLFFQPLAGWLLSA